MTTVDHRLDTDRIYQLCKALANPVRLEIVRFVQQHPRCIGNEILLHLPDETARAQSTLSQHLKILCAAGLLEAEPDGSATCYVLNQEQLDWLREQLAAMAG
ncbi:MAG TPA: metalloregulator ArsR/SmtB family transcription factor [Roseiflexaceae bacterium]|nr:metalloregulator ArsR/SmtB family transcription factor [Roseiflexaceae bacterium]